MSLDKTQINIRIINRDNGGSIGSNLSRSSDGSFELERAEAQQVAPQRSSDSRPAIKITPQKVADANQFAANGTDRAQSSRSKIVIASLFKKDLESYKGKEVPFLGDKYTFISYTPDKNFSFLKPEDPMIQIKSEQDFETMASTPFEDDKGVIMLDAESDEGGIEQKFYEYAKFIIGTSPYIKITELVIAETDLLESSIRLEENKLVYNSVHGVDVQLIKHDLGKNEFYADYGKQEVFRYKKNEMPFVYENLKDKNNQVVEQNNGHYLVKITPNEAVARRVYKLNPEHSYGAEIINHFKEQLSQKQPDAQALQINPIAAQEDYIAPEIDYVAQQIRKYDTTGRIDHNDVVLDGYKDAGRTGTREVIVADRNKDEILRNIIDEAKRKFTKPESKEETIELVKKLSELVDEKFSAAPGNTFGTMMQEVWLEQNQDPINKEILLGKITKNPYGGSCRHRSLLLKILADEFDVEISRRRGAVRTMGRGGAHAWNILHLDGEQYMVDVMHDPGDVTPANEMQEIKGVKRYRGQWHLANPDAQDTIYLTKSQIEELEAGDSLDITITPRN